MKLKIRARVYADLDSIFAYVSQSSPSNAEKVVNRIEAEFLTIAERPQMYQIRPAYGEGIRFAVVYRYLILFRANEEMVEVVRVMHGSRQPKRHV